jgi:hypothetical protein
LAGFLVSPCHKRRVANAAGGRLPIGRTQRVPLPSCPTMSVILALFLVNNARPALFENWTRPLKGPHGLLATARNDNYFSDMGQWNNRVSYLESVDRTAQSGCTQVGMDISENQLEYPFQALLRERNPRVRFVHTGVTNPSVQRCLLVVDQGLVSCRLLSLCVDTSLHTHVTHFVRRSFSLRPTLRRRTLTLTSFREDGAYWLHASCSTDSCGDAAVHCGWMASHRSVSAAAPGPRQWHRLRATVRPWLH